MCTLWGKIKPRAILVSGFLTNAISMRYSIELANPAEAYTTSSQAENLLRLVGTLMD
jgi:hypothetical protein